MVGVKYFLPLYLQNVHRRLRGNHRGLILDINVPVRAGCPPVPPSGFTRFQFLLDVDSLKRLSHFLDSEPGRRLPGGDR